MTTIETPGTPKASLIRTINKPYQSLYTNIVSQVLHAAKMAYSKIRELNGSRENWTVQARLCRLWEAVNFKKNNEVFALEMVFVDAQGDSIQGHVRKNHIARFKSQLKENEVYNIGNFKVGNASARYKVVPNSQRMYFNVTTSVRKVTTLSSQIPQHAFFFAPENTLEERVGDNTLLTDIIGCVTAVGPIQIVATGPKKDIELKNNGNGLIRVTLWGNITSMFDLGPYVVDNSPVIAIITSTTINLPDCPCILYKALTTILGHATSELSFSSTTATRTFFNIDLPEVAGLSKMFTHGYEGIKELQPEPSTQIPLAEQASLNRTTIAELLAMEWVSNNQEHFCTFIGEIIEVHQRYGWCYVSCNHCSKKLVPKSGAFLCMTCNKPCSYPVIRYKLHAHVRDQTGTTTLVIFNDDAEKHIKVPASTFMERVGAGDKNLPDEIHALIGKTFVFKIKVTDYNFKDGFENYTVSKIFEEVVMDNKRKVGDACSDAYVVSPNVVGSMAAGEPSITHPVTPKKLNPGPKKMKLQE